MQDHKTKFQDFEKKKVEQWLNYRLYGLHGFRIITMPAPMSILSLNATPFLQLTSKIDTSEELAVYRVLLSNDSLRTTFKWFLDFSSVLAIFGSLLALMFGFETFQHKQYLKLLSSIGRRKPVYFGIALARSVMLAFFLFAALVFNYALIGFRGVAMPLGWDLPILLVTLVLMTWCFFAAGALLGMVKNKSIAFLTGFAIFFLSLFGVPALADYLAFGDNGSIPSMYEMELNKMKILNGYQKECDEKHSGAEKDMPTDWDSFLQNEYKEIQACNDKMIDNVQSNANRFKWLSSLFPTSYYISVKNELSGSGYDNLVAFFRLVKKIRIDFYLKYIDVMRTNPRTKVEQFLKGEDNVIYSKTTVPAQFPPGTLITILYFSLLLWSGYFRYKKSLIELPKKENSLKNGDDIVLDSNETAGFVDYDGLLSLQLYCLLSNGGREFAKKGYEYTLSLDREDLSANTKKLDFLYVCRKDHFPPDVKTGPFLSLLMGLEKLPKDEKEHLVTKYGITGIAHKPVCDLDARGFENLVMAIIHLREYKIYFIDDVNKGWPDASTYRLRETMAARSVLNGALVLYLTGQSSLSELNSGGDNRKRPYFFQFKW